MLSSSEERNRWTGLSSTPTIRFGVLDYPDWFYYPAYDCPPNWAAAFVSAVASCRGTVESRSVDNLTSDKVLALLRPALIQLGYEVESGKHSDERIRRPVLFGDQGVERVAYEVDAVHDAEGVLVEIEAGRGARGNAVYRDLIRTSLIVGARYLALGVMQEYRHMSGGKPISVSSYREAKDQLDAIYASGRLRLPFEGLLLFGY
jgi:hypothetical protein